MVNPFRTPIDRGEIRTGEELKSLYRREARKCHPDLRSPGGGERDFIELTRFYEEAREYLRTGKAPPDPPDRSGEFYRYWQALLDEEQPHARTRETRERREGLRRLMGESFRLWQPGNVALYERGMAEFDRIGERRAPNDLAHLRRPLLYDEVAPLIYDLCRYRLSGNPREERLLCRMEGTVLARLGEEGWDSLAALLSLLLNGAPRGE